MPSWGDEAPALAAVAAAEAAVTAVTSTAPPRPLPFLAAPAAAAGVSAGAVGAAAAAGGASSRAEVVPGWIMPGPVTRVNRAWLAGTCGSWGAGTARLMRWDGVGAVGGVGWVGWVEWSGCHEFEGRGDSAQHRAGMPLPASGKRHITTRGPCACTHRAGAGQAQGGHEVVHLVPQGVEGALGHSLHRGQGGRADKRAGSGGA